MDPYVIPLEDARDALPSEVGRKALAVSRLLSNRSVRCPRGFVVTASAFRDFAAENGLERDIDELASRAGDRSARGCRTSRLCRRVRRRVEEGRLHDRLRSGLQDAYRQLGDAVGHVPLVARSSASTEDGDEDAQAGLYESVLGFRELHELEAAIKRVWRSACSQRAMLHATSRTRLAGRSAGGPAMAVLVQQLVAGKCSGVAFNADVNGGSECIVMEVVAGLGDRFLGGSVTPQSWKFDSAAVHLLERRLVPQGSRRTARRTRPGVATVSLPLRRRARALLTDEEAGAIARDVLCIARDFPEWRRLDCEFVVDQPGTPWFVQARPQTAIAEDPTMPVVTGVPPEAALRSEAMRISSGGETASLGAAQGRLLVVAVPGSTNPERDNLPLATRYVRPGDILVTPTTNISWTMLLRGVAGVITERGGVMSHTAIIAREMAKPSIVGAEHLVNRLVDEACCPPVRATQQRPGVWTVGEATLDATNRRVFLKALDTTRGRVSEFLEGEERPAPPEYDQARSEFPHFRDETGQEWTGKPEYPLSQLQFGLYARAWESAHESLALTPAEREMMPVRPSMAGPGALDGLGRGLGRIRPHATDVVTPGEYPVLAFPTEGLAALGDRILARGLSSRPACDQAGVLDDIQSYQAARAAAAEHFAGLMDVLGSATDVRSIDYGDVFRRYVDFISFAHLRATFRRRVIRPLRAAAIEALPQRVRRLAGALLLNGSAGLFTETTHLRDVRYRELLLDLYEDVAVRDALLCAPAGRAEAVLRERAPRTYRRVAALAVTYKIERYQDDRIESRVPIRKLITLLHSELGRLQSAPAPVTVFTRSREGYRHELERLRRHVLEIAPDHPFDSFMRIMILSWEFPALTDRERHLQHRVQFRLFSVLRRLQAAASGSGVLPAGRNVLDHTPSEFLDLVDACRRGGLPAVGHPRPSCIGPERCGSRG